MIKRSFLCIFQLLNTILFFLWFPYIWFCLVPLFPALYLIVFLLYIIFSVFKL